MVDHQPKAAPISPRVSIDLTWPKFDSQYAMPLWEKAPPFRENESELILRGTDLHLFENRWKFRNEIVNYNSIRCLDSGRIDLFPGDLLKVKLHGLPRKLPAGAQVNLLKWLSMNTPVQHLEIQTLDLCETPEIELKFTSLRLFAIGSIIIVRQDGEVFSSKGAIRLIAPELKKVYSDLDWTNSCLTNYIKIVDCKALAEWHMLGVLTVEELQQPFFQSLEVLVCNRYSHECLALIQKIAQGQLLPQLITLCCNIGSFDSASYAFNPTERDYVKKLYATLVNNHLASLIRTDLSIYIQGLHFDRNRPYERIGYHLKLVEFHFINIRVNKKDETVVRFCPSVQIADYFDLLDTFYGQLGQLPPNLNTLLMIYPNLRMVFLRGRQRKHSTYLTNEFLNFLSRCPGLTGLELDHADFRENFYTSRLIPRALQRLASLVILEHPGQFRYNVNFQRLFQNQFEDLRMFHTNIATKPQMIQLLRFMKPDAQFLFDFCTSERSEKLIYYRINIQLTGHREYHLIVQGVQDRKVSAVICQWTFRSLDSLQSYLAEPKHESFSLHHWMDIPTSLEKFASYMKFVL